MSNIPESVRPFVQHMVFNGWRVMYADDTVVQLEKGQQVNHILHFLISVLSCGLWVFVWIVLAAGGGVKRQTIAVPPPNLYGPRRLPTEGPHGGTP